MSLFSFNKLFSLHSLSIYYVPEKKQSVSIFKFSLKTIKKKKRETKTIIMVAACVKLTFHKHNPLMPLCNAPFHRWRHYMVCQESGRGRREWQECDGSALWAKAVTHAPPRGRLLLSLTLVTASSSFTSSNYPALPFSTD